MLEKRAKVKVRNIVPTCELERMWEGRVFLDDNGIFLRYTDSKEISNTIIIDLNKYKDIIERIAIKRGLNHGVSVL